MQLTGLKLSPHKRNLNSIGTDSFSYSHKLFLTV